MIELRHVYKSYGTSKGRHRVLEDVSFKFPDLENVGIVGPNGAGKSTLLRVIAGVEQPDEGLVTRTGRVSWPIGFAGGFNASLSGEENCRFVARIYGEDVDRVVGFTQDFAELGKYFEMPVRTYSSGMRARLAFGLSMAIDFSVYLVDEVTAVGDKTFQKKCRDAFAEREKRASVIIVSHSFQTIQQYCKRYAVLAHGQLRMYHDLKDAEAAYNHSAMAHAR